MILLTVFSCLALAMQSEPSEGLQIGKIRMESESKGGQVLYRVEARIVPLKDLLETISQKTGLQFEGLDTGIAQSLVNVSLADRRLDEVLSYVLGCVDLKFHWKDRTVRLERIPSAETPEGRSQLQLEGIKATYKAIDKFPAHPDSTKLSLIIAAIDEREGRVEEANQRYQGIIRNFPGAAEVPDAMLALGRNFLHRGEAEKAREFLWRLVNDFPRAPIMPEAYFLLGHCLLILQQVEMAEDFLESMTENHKDSPFAPKARIYLAEAKRRIDKAADARVMLEKMEREAYKEPSLREEFILVYGKTLFDLGENKKAAALLCEFASDFPKRVEANPALLQAALACFRSGDFLSALLLAKSIEGREGVDPLAWNRLVLDLRASLNLRSTLSPSDPGAAAINAAHSLHAMKKYDEAIETLQRFFNDPDYGAKSRVTAAAYHLDRGDAAACIRILQTAIPVCREESLVNEAFRVLGDAYASQGQDDRAAEAYRGILRRDP